jgi:hypothetical protein
VAEARGIAPGTYRWAARQIYYNIAGEYYMYKQTALYFSFNSPVMNQFETSNPSTPDYAQLVSRQQWGGLWTLGVKTAF